ncbi:MAG: TonB-dependent receptor plug domain-containing protein [Candidatus Didemnitutus sp.]|nr:TonB-dependent receptor plug domain-containing protein [Candidatus Didemnitutus sp.]
MNLHTSRIIRALLWLALPVFAFAQAAPTTNADPKDAKKIPIEEAKPSDAAPDAVKLDQFEVTGTRLRTLGDEAAAVPVFSIPQVELERRGVSRLADVRWAIPQLGGTVGFNDNLTNGGTSRAQQVGTSFNMRGLGGNSTLVLVDGRRIPHTGQEAPGGAGGREDFSVDGIPVSAIERIDILPQGAGAIYGSEAIAGVVNIVLKKNYTGTELRVTYDNTFKTDVGQTTVTLTSGYRSGKLSAFLSASWENQNGLASRDRWWTATGDARAFGSTSNSFTFNATAGAGSFSTAFYPANAAGANLPGLSTHVVLIPTGSNGTTATNAGSAPVAMANIPLYDSAAYAMSVDPAKRQSYLFRAAYQIAPKIELYGDARWSEFENDYTGAPVSLITQLPASAPGNPFGVPVYLSKVFYDLPRPHSISTQQNMGATLGARGDLLADWRYDVSAAWTRNIVADDALTGSGFNFGLLSAALAGPNAPLLAYDSLNGKNPNGAGVLEALMPAADHKDTTDVTQYLVTADGTIWSGWAGDIRTAVGAEAGEEKVKFWREPSPATPTYVLTKPFARKHTAAFAEIGIPLLSERQKIPLVYRVEIGGAVRATDYSDVGSVTTPTYRALFQPVKWLTFRASRAEGYKPVRLYDLQAPITQFTSNISATTTTTDPLRGGQRVPAGAYLYRSGGNPALNPEESVSRNAGVVLDVPGKLLKGLSFSADYYEIDYNNRSGSTGLQVLLNYFPERVFRLPLTPADQALGYTGGALPMSNTGQLAWDASNINLSTVTTKGWDYRASYSHAFDFGEILVTAAYTRPELIVTQSTPAAAPDSRFGHQPNKFSGSVFWARGPWDAGVSVNYQSRYFIGGVTNFASSYPSYLEWNPQVSYNFGRDARFGADAPTWWGRWLAGSKLTVTVINALNEEPTLSDAANFRFAGDPRLRRYILSFAKKF